MPTMVVERRFAMWAVAAAVVVAVIGALLAPTGASAQTAPVVRTFVTGRQAVGFKPTPSGQGLYVLHVDGSVSAAGDAGAPLRRQDGAVAIAVTATGQGYWLIDARGCVAIAGDARAFSRSICGTRLNSPIIDAAVTPSGEGYWLVAADGGVFAFGDAPFYGSMGGQRLNAPVVGMAGAPDGRGYWLVASDGGIFSFGVPFLGSMGGRRLNQPVTAMVGSGTGYMMVAADGGIFNYGNPFFGSLADRPPAQPVVAAASAISASTRAVVGTWMLDRAGTLYGVGNGWMPSTMRWSGTGLSGEPLPAAFSTLRAFYVVGSDRSLDPAVPGAIRHEVGVATAWFSDQSGGKRLRFRRDAMGAVTVTSIRSSMTTAQLDALSSAEVLALLRGSGLAVSEYAVVWMHARTGNACGYASQGLVLLAMQQCDIFPSAGSAFPFGGTYLLVHELTHALGAVPSCAPNTGNGGHVMDDPRDIVYAGPLPRDWDDLMLDPGRDDYFRHGRPGCEDIDTSPLWA
jgi:hypothetical protein